MLTGSIADVGCVGVSRIGADVDDTTRLALSFEISVEILRHHQCNGTTVDGEVRIDALRRRQVYAEALLGDERRIEGFEHTVGVVVDENIDRSEFGFTAIE